MQQEAWFFASLNVARTCERHGARLVLFDGSGARIATLVRGHAR
jgi:hypothetical protein